MRHAVSISTQTVAALVLTLAGLGSATADPAAGRVYSSLCTQAESGDISGFRIKIVGMAPDLTLSFEETEGALMAANDTKDVRLEQATGDLTFKVVTETGPIAFKGKISPTALDGVLTRQGDTPETVHLPSYAGGDGEGPCPATPDSAKP